jgi:hypothetical protein
MMIRFMSSPGASGTSGTEKSLVISREGEYCDSEHKNIAGEAVNRSPCNLQNCGGRGMINHVTSKHQGYNETLVKGYASQSMYNMPNHCRARVETSA